MLLRGEYGLLRISMMYYISGKKLHGKPRLTRREQLENDLQLVEGCLDLATNRKQWKAIVYEAEN